MAVYYINGTSNSGATFGQSGYFYPLYLTAAEANSASENILGTSHPHTFEEAPNITFYMPVEDAMHAQTVPPTGSYSGEVYISYTSPIAEIDVEEIGTGVLASDTFNSWRKKTNDVARETIANKALIGSVDTRLTRLLSVTGGENNIMTLSSSDNITGEKEFEGLVKFTAADDLANAVQVGADGKLYVSSSKFFFDKDVDLYEAGAELKASNLDLPTGKTKYAGVQYTWPSQAPTPGQILKSAPGNTLTWATEAAAEATVEAFLIEDPNPIGSVLQWTTNTPPSKWLICNGEAVSRTTYSDLFAVIGETYGEGDGEDTFNLPDLRARVPVGKGTNTDLVNNLSAAFEKLGSSQFVVNGKTLGGEYQHNITIEEMPIHGHAIPTRWDDGNNSGTAGNDGVRNKFDDSSVTHGGISLPNSDNGPLKFRGNFVTGLAGGNSYTAATRSIRETTNGSGLANLYDGSESGAAPFIGAGLPQEYADQTKINQGTNTESGDGSVQESLMNIVQPFIILNYIIKAEGSTIVEQNIKPSHGILINDAANQTNLLEAGKVNTIKMDVDSEDFEFDGNTLKLVDTNYRPGEVIEKFFEVVPYGSDSKTITLHGGSNFSLNTIPQSVVDVGGFVLTTTYQTVTASEVNYVCPVGAKTIIYSFHFKHGRGNTSPLVHMRLRLGPSTPGGSTALNDTEVDIGYQSHYSDGSDEMKYDFPFEIVETSQEEDIEKGKIFKDNWEGIERTIYLEMREYNNNQNSVLYRIDHQDGAEVDRFSPPKVGIETIAR